MTPAQTVIADKFIKILADNYGQSDGQAYFVNFATDDSTIQDLIYVQQLLVSLNIIEYMDEQQFRIKLTPKGEVAFKIGVEKYLESDLNFMDAKIEPAKHSRFYYLVIFTIAIIVGVIVGLLLFYLTK